VSSKSRKSKLVRSNCIEFLYTSPQIVAFVFSNLSGRINFLQLKIISC